MLLSLENSAPCSTLFPIEPLQNDYFYYAAATLHLLHHLPPENYSYYFATTIYLLYDYVTDTLQVLCQHFTIHPQRSYDCFACTLRRCYNNFATIARLVSEYLASALHLRYVYVTSSCNEFTSIYYKYFTAKKRRQYHYIATTLQLRYNFQTCMVARHGVTNLDASSLQPPAFSLASAGCAKRKQSAAALAESW